MDAIATNIASNNTAASTSLEGGANDNDLLPPVVNELLHNCDSNIDSQELTLPESNATDAVALDDIMERDGGSNTNDSDSTSVRA